MSKLSSTKQKQYIVTHSKGGTCQLFGGPSHATCGI